MKKFLDECLLWMSLIPMKIATNSFEWYNMKVSYYYNYKDNYNYKVNYNDNNTKVSYQDMFHENGIIPDLILLSLVLELQWVLLSL